jgi:hypothetical protein
MHRDYKAVSKVSPFLNQFLICGPCRSKRWQLDDFQLLRVKSLRMSAYEYYVSNRINPLFGGVVTSIIQRFYN